jgi:hypothetical protein
MFRFVWVAAVLTPVAVAVLGLRWMLADFLLDHFGARSDLDTHAEHPEGEHLASDRPESPQSSSGPEGVEH